MKEANKIARSKKMTEEDKIDAIMALGRFSCKATKEILTADYSGRIGFNTWALTNCRNRIKSAKAKANYAN